MSLPKLAFGSKKNTFTKTIIVSPLVSYLNFTTGDLFLVSLYFGMPLDKQNVAISGVMTKK